MIGKMFTKSYVQRLNDPNKEVDVVWIEKY